MQLSAANVAAMQLMQQLETIAAALGAI